MAKGEARYQSAGRDVTRFENTPVPRGIYGLPIQKGLAIKKSESKGPDAIPYINCMMRAEGTADPKRENSKDRVVFHKFFLSLKPGSDGVIMPERGGGIVEFCRANGDEADFSVKTLEKEDGTTEDYLDPEEVLAYLEEKVEVSVRGKVEIEAAKDATGTAVKGHPGNNKIAFWELNEGVMTGDEKKEEKKPAGKPGLPKKK